MPKGIYDRGAMASLGRSTFRFEINAHLERQAAKAKRATSPVVRSRRVQVDGKTLYAWDAHSILEATSDEDRARPGHPLG